MLARLSTTPTARRRVKRRNSSSSPRRGADGKIRLANRAAATLFDFKMPANDRTVLEATRHHEVAALVARLERAPEVLNHELRLDGLAGARYLQINALALRATNGGRDGAILIFHDLTRIRQLEAVREDFVANVSHGLRTPLSLIAQAKSVSLKNQVPDGLGANADPERLRQVLANLIDNAIKYGRSEGNVTLGGRLLEDARVQLTVRDDGPGIPPDAKERIFERFYRVDKARSREQGGTGLGLAIVKNVVLAHGGEVRVESAPGKGTEFFITLPAARAAAISDQ
ncbi:MAG: hypothetical protein EXS37_03015 [Opitutus sp.]|nr:hypothetical protein [Opitutus sp.]